MPPYTHLGGYIAKVDGRTEYQSVGPGNLFQITKKQAHEVLRFVPLLYSIDLLSGRRYGCFKKARLRVRSPAFILLVINGINEPYWSHHLRNAIV